MSIRYASEYVDLLKANRMVSQHGHLYLVFASYGRYVEIIRKNHWFFSIIISSLKIVYSW